MAKNESADRDYPTTQGMSREEYMAKWHPDDPEVLEAVRREHEGDPTYMETWQQGKLLRVTSGGKPVVPLHPQDRPFEHNARRLGRLMTDITRLEYQLKAARDEAQEVWNTMQSQARDAGLEV